MPRLCQVCENDEHKTEDEYHFIFECRKYHYERLVWLQKIVVPANFLTLPPEYKLDLVLNDPNNVKLTAQYIINIYDIRSKVINKLPSTTNLYSTNNATSTNTLFHLQPHDQCPACNSL